MNNKIANVKVEVAKTPELNDSDFMDCVLNELKNMANNLQIALNEASNQVLFDEIKQIFNETQDMQRRVFNLAFQKGWYTLEKADDTKMSQKVTELKQKLPELTEKSS